MTGGFSIIVLFVTTLASVSGSVSLKHATTQSDPIWAIVGVSLWAASGAGFSFLAKSQELGVLAVITSAAGVLLANLLGVAIFDEQFTRDKLIAFALLVLAMLLLA